jgi:hypothetical protein
MANEEHLHILRQGVDAWNTWRQEHPGIEPDLRGADLREADLRGANLHETNLSEANLLKADLTGAKLGRAILHRADLSGANLREANLVGADLIQANLFTADLEEANLTSALLFGTELNRANLSQADLSYASVDLTVFANVVLASVKGLETVYHLGSSSIGIDTLYRSGGRIPEVFLRGAGVPARFIEYVPSLVGQPIEYYSCFISHSHHDKRFCERLYADLQTKGVRVWYFPEDAIWGRSVWGEIDRSIRIYDKLVVVCSENSLQSRPVLREIERSLQREDQEGTHVLFPIRIDDYIFREWQHERKADVVAKVVGDFSEWDTDVAKYGESLARLMRGLEPWREESQ